MSGTDDTDLLIRGVAAAPALTPPTSFAGTDRFDIGRKLGEGSFGVVYEAVDRQSGSRVALKVLRRPTADWLYRFKREFRALADFSHPNVVSLYEAGNAGDDWFFTMRLVEGEPFLDYVRRVPGSLASALAQLARGLAALHGKGIVHRDVKPSNVLVGRDGHVVVLDFGLAVESQAADASALAGTPLYMAPEQTAIGPAADWYAVGVMLYQALTGRPPFGGSAVDILTRKAKEDPPRPTAIAPTVSKALDDLCLALLARDPRRRAGAAEIFAAVEPRAASVASSRAELFVGRQAELSQLLELLEGRKNGRPALALVHGASGIGKSALLRRFVEETRRHHPDALILSGRCFEREAVPFKALDGAIDALARALHNDPNAAELLPRGGAALVRLFPVFEQIEPLRRVKGLTDAEPDAWSLRSRGSEALRELFGRITDRRPVVIVVDDLQWGDIDSARLLGDLMHSGSAPALLFVGATREGEESSPFLRQLLELRAAAAFQATVDTLDLRLDPLDETDAGHLLSTLLPETASSSFAQLIAEGHGSPFFLGELARHAESGAGDAPRLAEVIQRRFAALSVAARSLLQAAAVAARPTAMAVLHEASASGDLSATVAELRNAHFLRARDDQGEQLLEAYHDRIRESVVASLDSTRKRTLHRALAAAYEKRGDHERVAIHLREAGDTQRAAELIVLAAERASSTTAFEHAARLYREAIALFREANALSAEREFALERALAESLSSAGRCTEAADAFISATQHADGLAAVDLRRRAVEELLLGGHLARGREMGASLLSDLGLTMPSTPGRAIAAALPLRARLWLRGGLRRSVRRRTAIAPEALVRLDTLWALVAGFANIEPALALALSARHALMAIDLGDSYHLLRSLVAEAFGAVLLKGARDGNASRQLLEQAQALLPHANRIEAEVLLLLGRGLVDYFQLHFRSALRHLDEAYAVVERSGLRGGFEATWPGLLRNSCHSYMGHIATVIDEAPAAVRRAEQQGNIYSWSMYYADYAMSIVLYPRRFEEAYAINRDIMRRWAGVGSNLMHYGEMVGLAHVALASGDGPRAWATIEKTWPTLERNRLLLGAMRRIEANWARGRAALGAATAQRADAARLLEEVARAARAIDREKQPWGRAISLSLRGAAAIIAGNRDEGARLLAEAEPLVEALPIESLLAAIQETRGLLIGGALGAALRASADGWRVAQRLPTLETVRRVYLPTTV